MSCRQRYYVEGSYDNVVTKIIAFLMGKDFTIEQACAVCGNVFQESGYDSKAINAGSLATGLFQWLGSRRTRLLNSAKKMGKSWNNVDFQLDFLWEELNNTEKATLKWFQNNKNEKSIDVLTKKWMILFERCGASEYCFENRITEAKRCFKLYNGNGENIKINEDIEDETNDDNTSMQYRINDYVDCIDLDNIDIRNDNNTNNNSDGGSNSGGGGYSGTVTNPKMKKVLSNLNYFFNFGKTKGSCKHGTYCPLTGHDYLGKCTYGPTTFYKNAGITLRFWCGVNGTCRKKSNYPLFPSFNCIKKTMDRYGFYLAGHWDFDEARSLPNSTFRPGDVATLAGSPCGAHCLMWTGFDWRSDVIEKNICSAYPNQHKGKFGNYSVCIWRRADCQEPQYQNEKPLPCTIC